MVINKHNLQILLQCEDKKVKVEFKKKYIKDYIKLLTEKVNKK